MKTLKEEREAIVETLSVKEVHLVGGFTETKSVIKCSQEQLRTALLSHEEKVVEREREKWVQRLPAETFSITIEGRVDGRILANRKFISVKAIMVTDGKTLLLEAEAAAHEMLLALTLPITDENV